MSLRPLELDFLAPGRSLDHDVVDGSGRMLLPRGVPVADEGQAKALWMRGFLREEDLRDHQESAPSERGGTAGAGRSWRKPPAGDPPAGLPRFFQPVARMALQLEEIVSQILTGRGSDLPEQVLELARSVQVRLQRDADAFLASIELSSGVRYGTVHALHSAALCELVARSQGIASQDRRRLVAAALTRDVGFLELQEELDRQTEPLSSEQQELVQVHPLHSARFLRDAGVRDPGWLQAVEQHHERLNGSGYPRGITGAQVLPDARLLGIADIFSAMTKPRAYRPAIQTPHALMAIFQDRGSLVDEVCTQDFVRALGLFSPGMLVRLASRECAVVTHRTENLKAPQVRAVTDPEGKLLPIYPAREVSDPAFAIVEVLDHDSPLRERLNHRQLWGEGASSARR